MSATEAEELQVVESQVVYDLTDKKALGRFICNANVGLLRAEYLYQLRRSGRHFQRRQEVDDESCHVDGVQVPAVVTHEEVRQWAAGDRDAIIMSVSHAWESMQHPDPCCYQLGTLVDTLILYDVAYTSDLWVFFDYSSLYQYQRSDYEQEADFQKAMGDMHVLYAHQCNLSLRIEELTPDDIWDAKLNDESFQVPCFFKPWQGESEEPGQFTHMALKDLKPNRNLYGDRGWCRAEVEWSLDRGSNTQNQRIDIRQGSRDDAAFLGRVPMTPEEFTSRMNTSKFTHRKDAEQVCRLQQKIFLQTVTQCREVSLWGLDRDEVKKLAHSLERYKELRKFRLKLFRAGPHAAALGEVLMNADLEELDLSWHKDTEETSLALVKALAKKLKDQRSLTTLDLDDTLVPIGSEALRALVEGLRENRTVTAVPSRHLWRDPEVYEEIGQIEDANQAAQKVAKEETKLQRDTAFPSEPRFKVLSAGLTRNWACQWLLFDHKIGGEKMVGSAREKFLTALKLNQNIIKLGFRNGVLGGAENCQALAQALREASVKQLELSWEEIADDGAKALLETIKANPKIEEVKLEDESISEEVLAQIQSACAANKLLAQGKT